MKNSKPRKTGIIIEPKKNQETLSPGFLLFSDCNNFFFLKFPFRGKQEQTHNTEIPKL